MKFEKKQEGSINAFKSDCFSLGLVGLEMAGIKNTLKKKKGVENFMKAIEKMMSEFMKKFEKETSENVLNKNFSQKLVGTLSEDPKDRSDFCDLFVENLSFDDLEKIKYHVFVQDMEYDELNYNVKSIFLRFFGGYSYFFFLEISDLALNYENKKGDENLKKALILYEKAAALGDNFGLNFFCYYLINFFFFLAMENLGYFYENGISCGKNIKKAFEFHQKAANLGNSSGNLLSITIIFRYYNLFL